MKIKLALIIDDLGLGGAQRQLVELIKGLPRDRYELLVIGLSVSKADYEPVLRQMRLEPVLLDQSGKWSWNVFFALIGTLRRFKPDIVHTWLFTADLYGRIAAWLVGAPVIICTIRSIEPWKKWHYVWADRFLRFCTRLYIVNAAAIGKIIAVRDWVDPRRITTITNGIDLDFFNPDRTEGVLHRALGLDPSVPLVGMLGRLAPEKNHAMLVRAAAKVLKSRPEARFVSIGSGPEKPALELLAEKLGIAGRIHFIASRSDVPAALQSLSVLAMTSHYEGCCNAILEAMAMGRPVVATAVGGNPELVEDGRSGFLVPKDDDEAMARAILNLLDDPQKAAAMGRRGRERAVAEFGMRRMVAETEAVYARLLEPLLKKRAARAAESSRLSANTTP